MQEERRVVNEAGVSQFFTRVYSLMGAGLILTAFVAYLLAFPFRASYIGLIQGHRITYFILTFLPLILSFFVMGRKSQQNATYGTLVFLLMSAAWGFSYAGIAFIANVDNLVVALATTATIFLVMSLVGHFGKRDLTKIGSMMMMGLFGIILLSVINMFIGSSGMQLFISYAIMIIFIVLIAWDTQRLRNLYMTAGSDGQAAISDRSLAVMGALMLYLDFLNLFTAILQIFGMGSDRN